MSSTENPLANLPLDSSLYKPSADEVDFLKGQTGIQDDEELKKHIIAVQKEAWDITPYLCIRAFTFIRLGITRHPKYKDLLKLGKERPEAIFLELGCGFGNDARKAIADGYPLENVVCSDIQPEFWDLGHRLFKTTPETYPVVFVGGNALDPNFLEPVTPFDVSPTTPIPALKTLNSLNPLHGHVSAIHTASFFHLFDEAGQLAAARALASLLSPDPGSMIFGHHVACATAGVRSSPNPRGVYVYDHSPETWKAMWDGVVFEKGKVEVWTLLREFERPDLTGVFKEERKTVILGWCIKRI